MLKWILNLDIPYGIAVFDLANLNELEDVFDEYYKECMKRKIFVSNLNQKTKDKDLYEFFPNARGVRRTVDVTCDLFYGTAIVFFPNIKSANEALNRNGESLLEHQIKIVPCTC